jgi:hypothetical protein
MTRLRHLCPRESQIQTGVLELLRLLSEVVIAERVNAGRFRIVRPPFHGGWDVLEKQLRLAVEQGLITQSQLGWVEGASEGTLDIVGQLTGGKHFEIEVKRPGACPEKEQRKRIDLIRANGGCADVVSDIGNVQGLVRSWLQ